MSYAITNNTETNQFELTTEGKTAIVEYELEDNQIAFLHTEVPPQLEGRGIGSALAKHVLEYAKEKHLQVKPYCPFIRTYIERHPEYQSLL